MTILKWPKHRYQDHEWAAICLVCTAVEGELTKDCPGEPMTEDQKGDVLNGRLDYYRKEGWTAFTYMHRVRAKMLCEPSD